MIRRIAVVLLSLSVGELILHPFYFGLPRIPVYGWSTYSLELIYAAMAIPLCLHVLRWNLRTLIQAILMILTARKEE